MKKQNYSLTYPKIVAIGFALLIVIGTVLLMLPISSKNGNVSLNDALFTATSASCITGLIPFDTYTNWSLFGQVVIICLIQTGGLGFITLLGIIMRVTKRKMSLKQKMLFKDSIGSLNLGDVKELIKSVLIFTASCEGAGALLLMTRFIPLTNVKTGIWMAVFTSISAYCNAGFDLMGIVSPSSSLITVNSDPVILLTISLLVIFGGLGFIVWEDIKKSGFKFKRFSAHTKLVITTTIILLVAGTIFFMLFEYSKSFSNMNFAQKLLNAFFCSVTPRTAGFNSIDVAGMTNQSKMLTIILMFIGGSSGSTAGGVKTTTIAIIVLCVIANMKNKEDANVFGKRITSSTIKRAISVITINVFYIFFGIILISIFQNKFALIDIIFECTSAIGTVGITTGISPELNIASQMVIIILMYVGRLTSMIFALSFIGVKPIVTTRKPDGKIMIG